MHTSVTPPLLVALACSAAVAQVPLTRTVTALPGPATVVAQPPGESRRLYSAVRAGQVRVVRDGALVPTPVLAGLSGIYTGGESGLLGLCFHPQFQLNGYLYVLYQTTTAPAGTRIARYTLNPANPEVADPLSALTILTINRDPLTNHQGGWIGFGPDGYLYISSGNGGLPLNSQNNTQLLGKLLRIDPDHDGFPADPARNYAIPPSSPFAGSLSLANEIWATGLRNPWRCSFDRLTGDLWIADVGDSTFEEVNFQPALGPPPYPARNYGYSCMEGSLCTGNGGCVCYDGALTLPIFEYGRSLGFATTGGYVYRGQAIPALRGTYILGDNGGNLFAFRRTDDAITEYRSLTATVGVGSLYALGEDQAGELYLCGSGGNPYKITPRCPFNCDGSTAAPVLNVADFTCFLQAFASGDPYANCDGSTQAPVLNVADFTCFLQGFATGCP